MKDVTPLTARTPRGRLMLAPAAAGFMLAGSMLIAPAHAYDFDLADGSVEGSLNTTISVGTKYDLKGYETTTDSNTGAPTSGRNSNDGLRSFDGGFVSKALKLSSTLELKKDNYGLFVRGTAFYDDVLINGKNKWAENNAEDFAKYPDVLGDQTGTFSGWSDEVKDNQGRGVKLQEAYVYGSHTFSGGEEFTLRVGNQTLDWGETLFYGGGLKNLNAYDFALNSIPGSDNDLLLPQGMVQMDFKFNDQLSASGFIQYDWEKSVSLGRGTFGSNLDIFVPGQDLAYSKLPEGLKNQLFAGALGAADIKPTGDFFKVADLTTSNAKDKDQFGFKLNYKPEFLKDTEFGLHYAKYNSRLQFIDIKLDENAVQNLGSRAQAAGASLTQLAQNLALSGQTALLPLLGIDSAAGIRKTAGTLAALGMLNNDVTATTAYPEGIEVYGLTFNTKVFGYTRIAGELTYRPNAPIYVDHPDDILYQATVGAGQVLGGGKMNPSLAEPGREYTNYGSWYRNSKEVELYNGSLSVVQPFGAVLGTDLMYVVAEGAFELISGLDDFDRYTAKGAEAYATEANPDQTADDRLDKLSMGYNLMLGANWNNVGMQGLNLKSTFRWTHDFKGNSHRLGRFEEGEKKINMGLTAEYNDVIGKLTWGGDAKNVLRKGVITGSVGYKF
ncbi:hypothetical protein EOPP23_02565 [Endozoicomonas sp. OPT23]|uniref:DUF1302 domain-containing protein n=1 Tax=Endozoicomonas sp. OPT23 TaxID=2072845 RepID=UPI00129AB7C5|nr:DUF1302 family protein [Endozoicomonas sp. OPT23]MRI31879.1 hypothetical protein [Endozoicomonas sp. OPT23]